MIVANAIKENKLIAKEYKELLKLAINPLTQATAN